MSKKSSIITKNDFIIRFHDDTKSYKATLLISFKQPIDGNPDVLVNFGSIRAFKGDGKTQKIAMRNCIREFEYSILELKNFL